MNTIDLSSIRRARTGAAALLSIILLGACASSGGTTSPGSTSDSTAAAKSGTATASNDSIADARATVQVSGLACPKCASNVEVQLVKIPGVRVENIDMKHGFVQVVFEQDPHPSPARLARAVEDSGLTYVGVAAGTAPVVPMPPRNPMLSGN